MPLEQNHDALGVDLYRVIKLYEAPPYVKAASTSALFGDCDTPAHAYADPKGRAYCTGTPAATWLSAASLREKWSEVDGPTREGLAAKIEQAADYWGVRADIDAITEKAASARRVDMAALPDAMFAVVESFDGGESRRHLPLRNAEEIKVAAAWLGRYRDEFLYDDRRAIARKILARADQTKAASDAFGLVERVAGYGACASKSAYGLLMGRVFDVQGRDEKLASDLREAAEAVKVTRLTPSTRYKLASLVDRCDRSTGVAGRYSDDLPRPEDVLFAVTVGEAEKHASTHLITPTGQTYLASDFERLSADKVRDHMGDGFADAVSDGLWVDGGKLAGVIATMPRDDSEAFDRMAGELGVVPVCKVAAARCERPSLAALAAVFA